MGISVDSATDVAKDAADVILLDKDLDVLADLGERPERLPLLGRHIVREHLHDAGLAERDETLTSHYCGPLLRTSGAVAVPGPERPRARPGRGRTFTAA